MDEYEMTTQIGELLPYDGPHGPDTVLAAAAALQPLVRYMNNATRSATTVPYAATVDKLVAYLESMAGGLDQLLRQLVEHLEHQAEDPALYDDRHDRPGRQTALEAAESLTQTRSVVSGLVTALERTRGVTSHLVTETRG